MSANTWSMMQPGCEGSEASLRSGGGGGASKSRTCPFNPAVLPFDHAAHTAVEVSPSDQLFELVLAHLCKHGVVVEEDATSFQMSRAEIGRGGSKHGGCCGSAGAGAHCGHAGAEEEDSLKNVSVSLGVGLFRLHHRGRELRALHQHVGDPVGTSCGAAVLRSLVLFREGRGPCAARAIQAFLSDILAESEKTATNTFQVYRWHIKCQFWQRVSRCVARPISSVVLPAVTSEALVNDLSEFLSEETAQFYQEHGIPYKRSYLLYGIPGSGKTSMIQALAGHFRRNLCYLSPTHPELNDDCLKSAIERLPENAIVVLEDVDALFGKGREKKIHQSPLTFSGLLNALDGVGNHSGMVFVLTTNFKEQLDPALIRDGRVDMRVRFDYCTPEQMASLFDNFYPPKAAASATSAGDVAAATDPEIAALEAKLALLRKAKTADGVAAAEEVPSGAAFRDALLVALGDRKVSAAQLQHFFVTHRKCTPAEAVADVSAIAAAVDQRAKEEAEKEEQAAAKTDGQQPKGAEASKQAAPGTVVAGEAKQMHVHIHTSGQ